MRQRINCRAAILCAGFFLATITVNAQRASIETIQFRSQLVNKVLPYNVILPADYRASRTTRYPVLYLLHGVAGHFGDWVRRTNIADYATQYRLIIVMPEGNDSWYVDSASVQSDKYETYILKELIPDVQHRYRTIETRYGRGIAGLSMGGFGALKFGLKSPETFTFAGSISGALAPASWTDSDWKNLKSVRDSVFAAFGPIGSETRKKNDIFEIVRAMSPARVPNLPFFYLDTGTEDFFASTSQDFVVLLREKNIPHEYRELPGNHTWAYWDQQVAEVLKVAVTHLRMPPANRHPR